MKTWDYHAGDQVRVVIKKHNGLDKRYFLYAGQLDTEIFKAAIRFLSQGYHSNLRFEGNKLEGTYTTDRDTTMLLSIPYEKNWTVYVDGKKTEAKMLAGVFTGIDLKAGKHRIRMVYRAAGILPGAILSGLSCLSFFCYIFAVRKIWKRNDVCI